MARTPKRRKSDHSFQASALRLQFSASSFQSSATLILQTLRNHFTPRVCEMVECLVILKFLKTVNKIGLNRGIDIAIYSIR